MKLQEIFKQLAYGELSQIDLGADAQGNVDPARYEMLVSHINLGLTDLHTRFFLKEGRLTLALQEGRLSYPLRKAYAVSARSSKEAVRYILDSAQAPYQEDIIKVEQVLTPQGWELALNDREDPYAAHTPSMMVLTVPADMVRKSTDLPDYLKTDRLTVVYRAAPPLITEDTGLDDPEDAEVELPYSHLQALLYFVASRVNNPIGMTNEFHAGNSFAAKYEAECARLNQANIQVDQGASNTRLERNGWV